MLTSRCRCAPDASSARLLEPHVADLLHLVGLGRRRVVVEEAGPPAEALDAEQLLREQAAVGLSELGVALVRNLAALEVEHRVHDRTRTDADEGAAPMVIDPSTEKGSKVTRWLQDDLVAWLVTVAADGTPVPTPVWFWWDGETLLVYSQPDKPKLRHIAANPRVALALALDEVGDLRAVVTGVAAVDDAAPARVRAPGLHREVPRRDRAARLEPRGVLRRATRCRSGSSRRSCAPGEATRPRRQSCRAEQLLRPTPARPRVRTA